MIFSLRYVVRCNGQAATGRRRREAMPRAKAKGAKRAAGQSSKAAAEAKATHAAPDTVTKRRVSWTRVSATDLHATKNLSVVMEDVEHDVVGDDAVDVCTEALASSSTLIDDEIERARLAATAEESPSDLTFLSAAHVEQMLDSVTNTVHEAAECAAVHSVRSQAVAAASARMGQSLASELDTLGPDAVTQPPPPIPAVAPPLPLPRCLPIHLCENVARS